ncbi:MAG TPA: hypothetical protein VGB59_06985 [Allosphingosinicella sp.]|jgi:hypothetical protein
MTEQSTPQSPDSSSFDEDVFPTPAAPTHSDLDPWPREQPAEPAPPERRIGWFEGHMPPLVDALVPKEPETVFTETRRLRHDGWTPEKKRRFLERFAECGILVEACEAAGMSAKAAYNLRDRDPLFAAGLDAACVKARAPLADEAYSRARNGVVERIYKDGVVVAERHRYDNRLTMAVLARLDSRIDRAEEKGAAHLGLVARWEDYLDAVAEDRSEDGLALLAAPANAPASEVQANSGDRELHELYLAGLGAGAEDYDDDDPLAADRHSVWEDEDGRWWTDYPPPAGFEGEEEGEYRVDGYRRTLAPAEQAVIDAEQADDLARAQAQRDAWFGFTSDPVEEEDGGGGGGSIEAEATVSLELAACGRSPA